MNLTYVISQIQSQLSPGWSEMSMSLIDILYSNPVFKFSSIHVTHGKHEMDIRYPIDQMKRMNSGVSTESSLVSLVVSEFNHVGQHGKPENKHEF